MLIDHPETAMGSWHWPGTASGAGRPAIAPPPSHPCQRSDSDQAGKRYVLGRNQVLIETWELRLSTQECDFLEINIPTAKYWFVYVYM